MAIQIHLTESDPQKSLDPNVHTVFAKRFYTLFKLHYEQTIQYVCTYSICETILYTF
jgi:hypothetical protein